MDQRTQFIAYFLRDVLSVTELCALYGVSRKTGYKWIDRYLRHGPAGLEERSRRPRRSAESDARRDRGRDPGRSLPAPNLGQQKAAGAIAQAPATMAAARPFDGVRHLEAAWASADQPFPAPPRPSRQADERDPRAP
jgi:transposase-like protein